MRGFSYRYLFRFIRNGVEDSATVECNNQTFAFAKVKRMFPMAEEIKLVRVQKLN